MPRPPRRAAAAARQDPTTTPTRSTQTNAITAAIPPFMLETPPHAPFLTTPIPPSNNPGHSIVPEGVRRGGRGQTQHTPTNLGNVQEQGPDQSQVSTNALGSTVSDPGTLEEQSLLESVQQAVEDQKYLQGLREISSLATWTLSSAKPGCALAQLRYPSPSQFWQSDGPQPHTLTLHFFKLVAIVKMRVYLDFLLDESYTPTKMKFFAGMSEGALVEFGSWQAVETTDPETGEVRSSVESIRGWLDVPLKGVGGSEKTNHGDEGNESDDSDAMDRDDENADDLMGGDVLKAMVVQVRICENHQNGKDTHMRGFQVFARDDTGAKEMRKVVKKSIHKPKAVSNSDDEEEAEVIGLQPAFWMADPEIR